MTASAAGYGLIVGIDKYDPKYVSNDLEGCLHDATGVRYQLVADTSHWSSATCTVLTNSAATKSAIRAKLASLASKAVSGDVVVYFQSSHGGTQNAAGTDTYLCTYNDDYADSELASDLTAFKTGVKVVIIVDACYAAGLYKSASTATVSATAKSWNFAQNVTDKMSTLRLQSATLTSKSANIGWMTACDYNEESWEDDPYGLFAGYVIAGFQNGDADADGKVTFLEIFNYADPLTRTASEAFGEEQDPQVLNTSLLGSIIAKDLSISDAALALPNAVNAASLAWTTGGGADWFGQTDVSYDGAAARSGIIGDNSTSWLQTTVTGAGILRFRWKVSSESGYDNLKFYCNGAQQGSGLSGEQDWSQQQYSLAAGTHVLRWVYSKDRSRYGGADGAWLDQVEWLASHTVTLNAEGGTVSPSSLLAYYGQTYGALPTPVRDGYFFDGWWTGENGSGTQVKSDTVVSGTSDQTLYANWVTEVSLAEALDETNAVWTTGGGSSNWVGVASTGYDGDADAARTGTLTNRAQCVLQTTVTGPVALSFWWRVSSSNGSDYLSFLIDGVEQPGKISGETDWVKLGYLLAEGAHALKWVYAKKTTTGQGEDCGWLDQVTLTRGSVCFGQSVYTTAAEGNASTSTVSAVVPVYGVGPVSASVSVVPGSATTADYSMSITGSTLVWAAGESGTQYVTVLIKGDGAVEGNEVFYLVLGNAYGGVIGDPGVCSVVIVDDDLGTVPSKGVYVSGVPSPSEGGRASGGGYCTSGKSVKVSASAKSGWTFTCWENGSQVAARTVAWAEASAAAQSGAMLCRAAFKPTSEIALPSTSNPGGQSAVVGVAYRLPLSIISENLPTVKISGLPAGLKLDAATFTISGVPTKAGSFNVTFTASNAAGTGASQTFVLTVSSLPVWAQGTFNGEAGTLEMGSGLATMSVTSLGKVSGKVLLAGTNFTFTSASYSGQQADGSLMLTTTVAATASASRTGKKEALPMTLTVCSQSVGGSTEMIGRAAGKLGDGTAALYRYAWKDAGMAEAAASYAGYYTVVLSPDAESYGSGFLLVTLDRSGSAKITGKLADGTAVSLSGTLVLDENGLVWIVLYTAPAAYKGGVLFGLLQIAASEDGATWIVQSLGEAPLTWTTRNPQATASYGAGFARGLSPVGGFYNTTSNLYAYYADKVMCLTTNSSLEAPCIIAGTNRYAAVWWDPTGLMISAKTNRVGVLTGLAASAVGAPVKTAEGWTYGASTNTVGLTLTVTSATGVLRGTSKAWFDYGTTHTSRTITYQGALVPVRKDEGDGIEGRGYFLWADKGTYANAVGRTVGYSFNWSYDFLLLDTPAGE